MVKKSYCFSRTRFAFVRSGFPKFYSSFTCSCARYLNTPAGRAGVRAFWRSLFSAERVFVR